LHGDVRTLLERGFEAGRGVAVAEVGERKRAGVARGEPERCERGPRASCASA
jgi:hypothetical protein